MKKYYLVKVKSFENSKKPEHWNHIGLMDYLENRIILLKENCEELETHDEYRFWHIIKEDYDLLAKLSLKHKDVVKLEKQLNNRDSEGIYNVLDLPDFLRPYLI